MSKRDPRDAVGTDSHTYREEVTRGLLENQPEVDGGGAIAGLLLRNLN